MAKNIKDTRGVTTVELTDDLKERISTFNETHPNSRINKSGICRGALEKELEWRLLQEKARKGAERT